MGMQYQELLSGWEGEDGFEAPDQSDFNLTVSTPPPVGMGVAGSDSSHSYSPWKALTSKREEALRQERQHRLPETTEDGIVGYWQSEIAAERRKAAFSPQRPARKHVTSSPSRPYSHNSDGENNVSRPGQSGPGAESSKSIEPAHDTLPNTEDFLPVAFEIARTKSLKKAVDYLIACNFLTPSPRDVAAFLRLHRTQLDPSSLGVFLAEVGNGGGDVEYWNQIRFNYFRPVSFVGMNVEQG
jgi:Sec7 domain